jgi:hypothetical protein
MRARVTAMAALLLASGAALGAEDMAQRAQRCVSVADSLERLVCYDRIFGNGQTATAAPPAVAARPPPAAEAPRTTTATPEFGADQLRRSSGDDEAAPSKLTATVQELRETRPNVFRITLENGQVWQQMDMDSLFHVQVGDTVEINRGRLGGYRMARQSRGGSGWVRVNRLK